MPVAPPEASPFRPEENDGGVDGALDVPNDFDLAEEFGGAAPVREEDLVPDDEGELPDIDQLRKRIPEKTQVLMEELFRAKLSRVQRVNPKKIR